MSVKQLYDRIFAACRKYNGDDAIECVASFESVLPKVFPPTYAGNEYHVELKKDGQRLVVLDSVQSAANRREIAALNAYRSKQLRMPMVDVSVKAIERDLSILEMGHRIASAKLRDSIITSVHGDPGGKLTPGDKFAKTEVYASLSGNSREKALRTVLRISPVSLVYGFWMSTEKIRIAEDEINAANKKIKEKNREAAKAKKAGKPAPAKIPELKKPMKERAYKFARVWTSQATALIEGNPEKDEGVGRRSGGFIDEIGINVDYAIKVEDTDGNWSVDFDRPASKESKATKINHGNIPPSIRKEGKYNPGGFYVTDIKQEGWLTIPALYQYATGNPEPDCHARTYIACLALCLDVLQSYSPFGLFLRSGCHLKPEKYEEGRRYKWIGKGGEFHLNEDTALQLYGIALDGVTKAGLLDPDLYIKCRAEKNVEELATGTEQDD